MIVPIAAFTTAPLLVTGPALLLPFALAAMLARRPTGTAGWACLAVVAVRVLAALAMAAGSNGADRPGLIPALDLATCAALVWIALRSRRHYPLILAAIGLIAVVAHGLALVGLVASAAALDTLLAATSCTMLLVLITVALRRRGAPAPIADNFPAGSACPGPLNR